MTATPTPVPAPDGQALEARLAAPLTSAEVEILQWRDGAPRYDGNEALVAAVERIIQARATTVAAEVERAVGEALTEMADKWQWGGWSDALLPWPVGTKPVLGVAQRVTDWMRARVVREGGPR